MQEAVRNKYCRTDQSTATSSWMSHLNSSCSFIYYFLDGV